MNSLSWLRGWWVFLLFPLPAIIESLGGDFVQRWQDRDIHQHIRVSLAELENSSTALVERIRFLYVFPEHTFLNNSEITALLAQNKNDSRVIYYGSKSTPYITISAQSIDQKRHLAHEFLEGYKPFDVDNVMMPLYVLAQRKTYLLDSVQYPGKTDVWQSSRQAFLYTRGDCEDHAIALADWLIEMNHDARVVVGTAKGQGHAWVVLFKDGKEFLLEATSKRGVGRATPYPLASLFSEYQPLFMFNRQMFWVNQKPESHRRYSGLHWVKTSRYDAN